MQLYVIRVNLGNNYVTCLYALMTGKSYDHYRELFSAIKEKCRTAYRLPEPAVVYMDFEQSSMRAAADVLGPIVQRACFYHFTQSTWRKVYFHNYIYKQFKLTLEIYA